MNQIDINKHNLGYFNESNLEIFLRDLPSCQVVPDSRFIKA